MQSLMWDSAWNSGPEDYTRLNDSRFDGLWTGRSELLVLSGDTVWVFTYFELEGEFTREDLLEGILAYQAK